MTTGPDWHIPVRLRLLLWLVFLVGVGAAGIWLDLKLSRGCSPVPGVEADDSEQAVAKPG